MQGQVCRAVRNIFMGHKSPHEPFLVVLGATGTGKSQLAVDLAKRFNGEIINGDAMQMYAGLPIITNKITAEEQQRIPHHLLGCVGLDEEPWRVGLFQRKALQIIKEIRGRGRIPVLVGGTHYYTQSLLFKNLIAGNTKMEAEPEFSSREIAERFPVLEGETEHMVKILQRLDPIMAERWHPNDRRKIRRSLEIFLLTGRKASDVYAEQEELRIANTVFGRGDENNRKGINLSSTLIFWVHAEPDILKKRLDARVLKMVDSGLLEEVRTMDSYLNKHESSGVKIDRTRGIWPSIGWKEFEPYLTALKLGIDSDAALKESIERTQIATRQYAKKQRRWIQLTLRPALAETNCQNNLYLLDGSDGARFEETVSGPAITITAAFLSGQEIQPPETVSDKAREILGMKPEKPDVWFRETCELCQLTAKTETDWTAHLKSRGHKGLLRKKKKTEERNLSFAKEQ